MKVDFARRYTCAQAAKLFPRRRDGKKIHRSTIYRWTSAGLHGVVLESEQVGNQRCVTKAAIERFIAALTAKQKLSSPVSMDAAEEARAAGVRLFATVFRK